MLHEFTAAQLLVLPALVFFAGIVDALAGGGGLITLPAYMAAGVPPALLLGTNKMASTIGTVASMTKYVRSLRFPMKAFLPVVAVSLVGAVVGARLILLMDPRRLRGLLLAALPLVGAAVFSRHSLPTEDRSAGLGPARLRRRQLTVAFPLGVYDGFFGPGTGTFLALGFARACRYDLLTATAAAKILNLASNAAALATFLWAGKVHLALGAAMGVVSLAGHWTGSQLGLKKGDAAIRPVIVAVLAGLFLKLAAGVLRGQ